MTTSPTPASAANSEADRDLFARLDEILVEESPMHPFGCATWLEASQIAVDMAKDRIRALQPHPARMPTREEVEEAIYKAFGLGQENDAAEDAVNRVLALFHAGETKGDGRG